MVVVGGGLAGMVAALHLARGGMRVDLHEASDRLGGKSGSDWSEEPGHLGYFSDHGYHVFPAWYHNTWALIRDLGIDGAFQRRRHFWRLPLGRIGTRGKEGLRLRLALRLAQISPRSLVTAVDLVSRDEDELETMSLACFIATRWYNGPGTGQELRDISLKGLGNPADRASAITFRANMRLLLKTLLKPNWTAAHGSLQECFINPFADRLREEGVTVHTASRLTAVECTGSGDQLTVDALTIGGQRVTTADRPVVLTLPHERLTPLLAGASDRLPAGLAHLGELRSRPMVAVDVHLARRIAGLPRKGHVILDGSRLHLTVLDIRPVWTTGLPAGPDDTVLQVIAADVTALAPGEDVIAAMVADLRQFFPLLTSSDITRVVPHPNDGVPLFMNDVGTDRARPTSERAHGTNLHLAGDWCANPVQLACMEGAVLSAGLAATAVLGAAGRDGPELRVPATAASPTAKGIRTALAPVCWLLGQPFDLAYRLRHRWPPADPLADQRRNGAIRRTRRRRRAQSPTESR